MSPSQPFEALYGGPPDSLAEGIRRIGELGGYVKSIGFMFKAARCGDKLGLDDADVFAAFADVGEIVERFGLHIIELTLSCDKFARGAEGDGTRGAAKAKKVA